MGRKRGLYNRILTLLLIALSGCTEYKTEKDEQDYRIIFNHDRMQTRSIDPEEDLITDISLMIFDEKGDLEDCFHLSDGRYECTSRLVKNNHYTFCACANFGYQVYADHIDELEEIIYYMSYPDEYREGIPMAARKEVTVGEEDEIHICLERLMAKISLRMDRSRLSEDVKMNVRSVVIGNCPKSVSPFAVSRSRDEDDSFPVGFHRNELETADLNYSTGNGLSRSVSLYMLENMQGSFSSHINHDHEKILDKEDPRAGICSYIEMELDYLSDKLRSGEKGLIYRFYLGEDRNSLDVERNCHYQITVTPEDDGLSEDSWRVDKSGLIPISPISFKAYPSDYIRGDIGDRIHIWCEFTPSDAPFDIGISYMEDDRKEGIYDYVIDEDGHGAVLTLTGPGTGLIYMEAGAPVNEAALFIIEVNLP